MHTAFLPARTRTVNNSKIMAAYALLLFLEKEDASYISVPYLYGNPRPVFRTTRSRCV
jgi:hypothetical protein